MAGDSTSGIYLFCNTIAFASPSVSAFFCNYISTYSVLAAETTFSGQSDRVFTPTIQPLPVSTTSSPTIASRTGTSNLLRTASPSATSDTASTGDDGEKKATNKGAIIGGTIGGVVGLVLIAAAVFLLMRLKKTKRESGPVIGDEYTDTSVTKGPASASEEIIATPLKTESKVKGKQVVA